MPQSFKRIIRFLSSTLVIGAFACQKDDAQIDSSVFDGGVEHWRNDTDSGTEAGRGPTRQAVPNGAFLAKVILESHSNKHGGTASSFDGVPALLTFSLSVNEWKGQRRVMISDASGASNALLNDSQPELVKATDKLSLGSEEASGCRGVGPVSYNRFEL